MNKGGMRYFRPRQQARHKPRLQAVAFRNLTPEQQESAMQTLRTLAVSQPMGEPPPECKGESCMEFPGEIRLAEFAWKNTRPMIQVAEGAFVSAADVALFIRTGEHKRPGMTVSHLCGNPRCVNPTHMEEMTLAENKAYGMRFEMELRELKQMGKRGLGVSPADAALLELGYGIRPRDEES